MLEAIVQGTTAKNFQFKKKKDLGSPETSDNINKKSPLDINYSETVKH